MNADSQNDLATDRQAQHRFVDSQPILTLMKVLGDTGRETFHLDKPWEVCLCALVLRLKPNCSVRSILEALPASTENFQGPDLLNTMANLGYYCRRSRSRLEEIEERLLPAIFVPEDGEPFIVLGRDANNELQFFDPVSKLVSNVQPNLSRSGAVWFFQHYDENRQATSRFMRAGSNQSWFRALTSRFSGTLAQILIVGFFLNVIALCTPLYIMMVYDQVISAGSIKSLPVLALGAIIAVSFEWKLRDIRTSGLCSLSGRLDNIVSNRIFSQLIGLPAELIERASVSSQIARIKTFESVRDFFGGSVFLSLLEAPFVVLSLAAIAWLAGPLVFVPLSVIWLYLTLFWYARTKVKTAIRVAAKCTSARQQFTIETIEKLTGIRGAGLQDKWMEKFRHLSGRDLMSQFELNWLGVVAETLAHSLTVFAAVATIGFGAQMIWSGSLSAGGMVAAMILVWRVLTPFYSLCSMIPRLEQLRNSIIQINTLIDLDTENEQSNGDSKLSSLRGLVSFHGVAFRPGENQDEIFSGLSFRAEPGEVVAVTGPNGSGKAAVLQLAKSLHVPSRGVIRIDGFDIRQLQAHHLRRQIAYVPKVPTLYRGTIAENLRFSNPLAQEEQLKAALQRADAWDRVESCPDGLDTFVAGRGAGEISSGFAYQLSLARAYLQDAPIMLIDELPNSLLAGRTGDNLKEYIEQSRGTRTILICLYRQDWMRLADKIVWLRPFESPQVGSSDELLEIFASMELAA